MGHDEGCGKIGAEGVIIKDGNGYSIQVGPKSDGNICDNLSDWELIKETNMSSTFLEKMALLTKKEPERSFIKAGVTTKDGELTDDGRRAYFTWRFEQDKEAFNKEVVQPILKEDEKD